MNRTVHARTSEEAALVFKYADIHPSRELEPILVIMKCLARLIREVQGLRRAQIEDTQAHLELDKRVTSLECAQD